MDAVTARKKAAIEAAATKALAELLGRAGLSARNKTYDELVIEAKKKVLSEKQIQTVELAVAAECEGPHSPKGDAPRVPEPHEFASLRSFSLERHASGGPPHR